MRAARASRPRTIPGAIAPPTKAPAWSTASSVVAVPQSTTTAGVPYRWAAAYAFTRRSGPTSPGRSTRTGKGIVPAEAVTQAMVRRAAIVSIAAVTGGTVEARAMPATSARSMAVEPEKAVEEELQLVRRRAGRGRGAPGPGQDAVPGGSEAQVRVADVDHEEHAGMIGRERLPAASAVRYDPGVAPGSAHGLPGSGRTVPARPAQEVPRWRARPPSSSS